MNKGLWLKFCESRFASDSVKYSGHIIENNSIGPIKGNFISINIYQYTKE